MAKRYSGALDEQEAYEYHKKVYGGIHTFYIRDIQEYIRLRPLLINLNNSAKIIAKGKLKEYRESVKRNRVVQEPEITRVKSKRGYMYPSIKVRSKVGNRGLNKR